MNNLGWLEVSLKGFGVLWVVTIVALAVLILPAVQPDARLLVIAVFVVFVVFVVCILLGVSAVVLMRSRRWRWSGVALMVSAATPSGFGYIGNLLALLIGLWLLLAGGEMAKHRGSRRNVRTDQPGSSPGRAATRNAAN